VSHGSFVGDLVGESVGLGVGCLLGESVGLGVGESVGLAVGCLLGASVGLVVGSTVGVPVGVDVSAFWEKPPSIVGSFVGAGVGSTEMGQTSEYPDIYLVVASSIGSIPPPLDVSNTKVEM
jgi:hypothetical protein